MKGKWLGIAALVVVGGVLLSIASCGRSQQLVSIEVQPNVYTFGASNIPVQDNAGSAVQLRALGSYIHPPVTKDITNEVTWVSSTTQMMTVNSTGLLTATGLACGSTLVSATLRTNTSAGGISSSGTIVTGSMTGNVICFSGTTGSATLTVTFIGAGLGTVGSSPAGLPSPCGAPACIGQFPTGTTVTLTATPTAPSTFGSWTGCTTPLTTNPCSVTMNGNQTVTVAFN
jgi:Divergent InlB B-repeat domain